MADFLTREGIIQHLESIIAEANGEVILISPYIKLDNRIQELLGEQKGNVDIHVVYRENKLKPNESRFLERHGIKTSFLKDLHAKCYLNEKEVMLTSMNLYEHSLKNNVEIGLAISKNTDENLYNKIRRQVSRWMDDSEGPSIAKHTKQASIPTKARARRKATSKVPKIGFCIRCKTDLPANPEKPYCKNCYETWSRFENPAYEEKNCHTCGKKHKATLLKPLCSTCYKKYKDSFTFVTA